MKHRLSALMGAAFFWAASLASAQQLAVTGSAPKLDGIVSDKEYSLTVPVGKIALSAARTGDTLFLAVNAPTTGWVAVGFGSDRMDGARLFIGFVAEGKPRISQQLGKGHGHKDDTAELELRSALGEAGGVTTLEISLRSSGAIAEGQKELWVLASYGTGDSFTGYHAARGSIKIQL